MSPSWSRSQSPAPRATVAAPSPASAGTLDVGPQGPEALVDALVAAVDLAHIADDRLAVGGRGGEQQGHAGADVGRLEALPVQRGGAVDDHPVGVADDDPGPHADPLVHQNTAVPR